MTLPLIAGSDLPRLAYSHGPDHDAALTHPQKFRPVVNSRYSVKPEAGGLWTAPVTREGPKGEIADTAWTDWCRENDYALDRYTGFLEITPNPDARVLRIDSQPDLTRVMGDYELKSRNLIGLQSIDHWAVLDYERMAEDGWDAVYLTTEGQWGTRIPPSGWSLYGWDVETVLWLLPAYTIKES